MADDRSQIDLFMAAISGTESGSTSGNYGAQNASGAYGRFQIMPSNWPAWSQEALGSGTWERSPENQDTVAKYKMLQYFDTYGSWDAVAIAWFAGPSRADSYMSGDLSVLNISDGGTTVRQYVDKMRAGMANGSSTTRGLLTMQPYVPSFAPAVPATQSGVELRPQTWAPNGRLAPFTLANFDVEGEVAEAVTGTPTLELSMDEASKLSFTINDQSLTLLASGLLTASGPGTRGTQLRYLDMLFEVTAVAVDGDDSPHLAIDCQPLGLGFLRRATGALVVADTSPTDFALVEAEAAGLAFVGEPTEPVVNIERSEPTGFQPGAKGAQPMSSWDVIKAQAKDLGYVTFVGGNTLYFGRQTWLMARPGCPTWFVEYNPNGPVADGHVGLAKVPHCRRAIDNNVLKTELELEVDPLSGNVMRPGDRLELVGVPTFDTDPTSTGYLVTKVTVTLDSGTPTRVSAATPVDPLPPAPFDYSGSVSDPANPTAGSKRGHPTGVDDGTYVWPVQGPVTSPFGARMSPTSGATSFHPGIDIGVPNGTQVVAARTGKVVYAGRNGGYGVQVRIEHADGAVTTYNHLQDFLVQVGQEVGQGQVVALSNNTGTSTGPHLDFQILPDGTSPADPLDYLPPA